MPQSNGVGALSFQCRRCGRGLVSILEVGFIFDAVAAIWYVFEGFRSISTLQVRFGIDLDDQGSISTPWQRFGIDLDDLASIWTVWMRSAADLEDLASI
jgi:hypothetical protein